MVEVVAEDVMLLLLLLLVVVVVVVVVAVMVVVVFVLFRLGFLVFLSFFWRNVKLEIGFLFLDELFPDCAFSSFTSFFFPFLLLPLLFLLFLLFQCVFACLPVRPEGHQVQEGVCAGVVVRATWGQSTGREVGV